MNTLLLLNRIRFNSVWPSELNCLLAHQFPERDPADGNPIGERSGGSAAQKPDLVEDVRHVDVIQILVPPAALLLRDQRLRRSGS